MTRISIYSSNSISIILYNSSDYSNYVCFVSFPIRIYSLFKNNDFT